MFPTSNPLLSQLRPDECRCGCGKTAIPGTEVEAAQMVMLRTLADRLRIVAALEDERGEAARELLHGYQRAMYGLDGFVHQNWDDIPVRLGCPTTAWIEFWRRRALFLIEMSESQERNSGALAFRRVLSSLRFIALLLIAVGIIWAVAQYALWLGVATAACTLLFSYGFWRFRRTRDTRH